MRTTIFVPLSVTFRIICLNLWNYLSGFRNYLSPPICVRKLDKAQKFLYADFILSFLPEILGLGATIRPLLRRGKHTKVSFTLPDEAISCAR